MARYLDHWRPVRQHRNRARAEVFEVAGGVDDLAADHGHHRLDPLDRFFFNAEEVRAQCRQVCQLADADLALLALLRREPGAAVGEQLQRGATWQTFFVQRQTANGAAADHPVQRGPRVVAGHAGGVGAGANRHAFGEHALDRWRGFGSLFAVAIDEVFTLERHAILNRDTAAQRFHTLDVLRGDGFGVVEEPRQTVERNVAVDLLEHVEHAADRFVVRGVQTERPALLNKVAHHRFQFLLHGLRQVRARFEEVFEVGGGEHQHFAGAVVAQVVVALMQLDAAGPVLEIGQLFFRLLGEQVVGDANGQLVVFGQLFDYLVIVRIVLETTAGVDRTGQAEAIEFAHELAGRVDLIFQRQLRPFGQGRVENHRVRPRDQHAGRVAVAVAHDLAARRVRRVAGVTGHAQGGAVEQRTVVEVQDEHRSIRRGLVDFFQGRHAFFGELEFVPATDHAHPLRGWRAVGLVLEHAQRVGERWHTFPAQFEVVVQTAANQVQVRVVEARDDAAALHVDHLCGVAFEGHGLGIVTDGDEAAVLDRHRTGQWFFPVYGMKLAIE